MICAHFWLLQGWTIYCGWMVTSVWFPLQSDWSSHTACVRYDFCGWENRMLLRIICQKIIHHHLGLSDRNKCACEIYVFQLSMKIKMIWDYHRWTLVINNQLWKVIHWWWRLGLVVCTFFKARPRSKPIDTSCSRDIWTAKTTTQNFHRWERERCYRMQKILH